MGMSMWDIITEGDELKELRSEAIERNILTIIMILSQ